ncbi:UDP-glucose flavonoid 3-O-glucosyltransferase 6 [Linum grandiflorum]
MTEQQLKLVFIPYPGVGHLASMVELAKHLLHRHSTLSVTLLITTSQSTSASVTKYTDSLSSSNFNPRIKLLNLPNNLTDPPPKLDPISIMDSQKPQLREAVSSELATSGDTPRLAGLVLDMFCTSMMDVADELGVPSFIFFTSSASSLGFVLHMHFLFEEKDYDIVTESTDKEVIFPAYSKPVPCKVFPHSVFNKDRGALFHRMATDFRKAKGILVNTIREVESYALDSLSRGLNPNVYPVGPILNLTSNISNDVIIQWLDQQPDSSVVFLCFGSMGAFCGEQVKEIAHALESSGHRFLWSLRRPPSEEGGLSPNPPMDYEDVSEVLPEGFLDRTAEVGRVIGWAPQTAVLAHKAVGGFVSHCGWNSTLESIWFGVPMATWPMYAEQQLNAFLVVEELGIATEIKMDYQVGSGDIVKADDVERGIRRLMDKDCLWKKKLKQISDKAKEAIRDGGSSSSSITDFLGAL